MTTHAQREDALARIRVQNDQRLYDARVISSEADMRLFRRIWFGAAIVIAAIVGYGVWQRFVPAYDQAAHDAMQACRDRGDRPVVYHAGDGKVLGVSCIKEWAVPK